MTRRAAGSGSSRMRTSMLAGGRSSVGAWLKKSVQRWRHSWSPVLRERPLPAVRKLSRDDCQFQSHTHTLQDGAGHARAHDDGRSQCARSRGPFPALSLPGFPLSCRARSVAASGRSAVKCDPVSAHCHVLRSLRYVSEPRAVGASAPGLQQHHPDMQWQHPADQPSQ